MSIGLEIKQVYQEVGSSYYVYNRDTLMGNKEWMVTKVNSQVTKPFIREFFLEGQNPYDTVAQEGYYIIFTETNTRYMIMNLTPELFEDSVIRYNCVLYKTNIQFDVARQTLVRDMDTYKKNEAWQIVESGVHALSTRPIYGNMEVLDFDIGIVDSAKELVFVPSTFDIQLDDRILFSAEEYYWVSSIMPRRFPQANTLILTEDKR